MTLCPIRLVLLVILAGLPTAAMARPGHETGSAQISVTVTVGGGSEIVRHKAPGGGSEVRISNAARISVSPAEGSARITQDSVTVPPSATGGPVVVTIFY